MSTCPTCGQPVRVHQSSEVTGCFVPGQPDEEKIMAAFEATVPPAIQRRNEFGGYVNPAINLSWMEFRAGYLTGYSARPESEAERVLREYGEAKKVVVELASKLVSDKNADEQFGKALKDMENLARKLAGGGE